MKRMLFIMNPQSGMRKGPRYLSRILSIFNEAGYVVTVHITSHPGDCTRVVEALAHEMDVVACCGGDGTFNETINGLIRSGVDVPVGYIPAGSTNDLASTLGLSFNILQAARDIVQGKPYAYDVGTFGDRCFCYIASFGIFTQTSYATPQNLKNAFGHGAYVLSGIQELSQLRTFRMHLKMEDRVIEDEFLFGSISNTTTVGGVLNLDPRRVDLSDGKFELLLIKAPRDLVELSDCIRALQQQQYDSPLITFCSTDHIRIIGQPGMTWTLDGEKADGAPVIEVRNLHNAIRLLQKG